LSPVEAVKELFIGSGAGWVLWLLAALSVVSFAIIIERFLFFRRRGADLRSLAEGVDRSLSRGDVGQAIEELKRSDSVAASIAASGLRLAHLGPEAVDKAMQSAAALERGRLEARLAYLGTVGNNAPFVGLFGTVIGIIRAFEELGHAAPGHAGAAAASQIASQGVMTGIAEALVTTAVGIAVALPAVAAYNYLQRKMTSLLADADVLDNLVLAYLSGRPSPVTSSGEAAPGGGAAGKTAAFRPAPESA
jgi:biopolymer transport protein ExbB